MKLLFLHGWQSTPGGGKPTFFREHEVVPIADSRELLRISGLPESASIIVGTEHRLADDESLEAMVKAVEATARDRRS